MKPMNTHEPIWRAMRTGLLVSSVRLVDGLPVTVTKLFFDTQLRWMRKAVRVGINRMNERADPAPRLLRPVTNI